MTWSTPIRWELLTTAYDDHSMKEMQACPPVVSYKLHSTSTIDVVNADQVGAADYSLSHSYMTATSDVCITTDMVIDAAPL